MTALTDVERRVLRAISAEPCDPREAIPALDEGGHDVCERLVRAGLLAWDSPLVCPEVTAAGREALGVGEWEDIVLWRCDKHGDRSGDVGPVCWKCSRPMTRLTGRVRPDTGDDQ